MTHGFIMSFQTIGKEVFHHVDNDEEVRELATHLVPKQTSYHELISCLEDVLCFLNNVVTLILQMPYHE